jgi:hypothetical protein
MDFLYTNNIHSATKEVDKKELENTEQSQQSIITRIGAFFSYWNPFSSTTNVHTVKNIENVFIYLSQNLTGRPVVIFDVDKVLLHRSMSSGKSKRMVFPSVVESVNSLSKYADVVCITARNFLHTVNLDAHGLKLCRSYNNITLTRRQIQQLEQQQLYFKDNIFYTERQKKSLVLNLLWSWLLIKYSSLFFIDDQFRNCQDIALFCTQNNINMHSLWLENPNPADNSTCCFQADPRLEAKLTTFFHESLEEQTKENLLV